VSRRAGIAAALLTAALLGVGAMTSLGPAELPSAEPAPPPPELARFLPLDPSAEPLDLDYDWAAGEVRSTVFARRVRGWVELEGASHARIDYRRTHTGQEELYLVEWLRADAQQVVCSLREVGDQRYPIEPPQPILVLPLRPGQTWSWEGTVGGVPAQASFEVLERRPDETYGELLTVRSTTHLEGQEATHAITYAAGRGPVSAHGVLPRGDLSIVDAGFDVEPYSPPE
jgi:hypothetical protein